MFVFNVKFSKTKLFKIILLIMAIICICLAAVATYNMFNANNKKETFLSDCMPEGDIAYLTDENYTNILKEVHENLDTYIGQKVSYTGYIYRVQGLSDEQFILARDMNLNDNTTQTVVVGFLCNSEKAKEFDTYSWVKITGTIEKGNYFGDIPCLNITEIKKCDAPENKIVPAPNENFIETSIIY